MKKIAIIAKYHLEASLCLAIHIAKQGYQVDLYSLVDLKKREEPGFEYYNAPHHLGIVHLDKNVIPEIYNVVQTLPISFNLVRYWRGTPKVRLIDNLIIRWSMYQLKKKSYDAYNLIGHLDIIDVVHKCLNKCNLIHTFHEVGDHLNGILSSPLIDLVIKDRTKVILPSAATYNRFIRIPNASNCQSTQIPIGIFKTLLLYEKPIDMKIEMDFSKTTFLFYGRLAKYKGLSILKESVNCLNDVHHKFNIIIAGAGQDETIPYFQSLENVLIINKHLSNNEIIYLNRICSVVIMPYLSASQSGIVLTSFMVGRPIIATKVGALTEVIIDGVNGLLVEKDNSVEFAKAMRLLIENPSIVKQLSQGALQFGRNDKYDWDNIARESLNFYFQ